MNTILAGKIATILLGFLVGYLSGFSTAVLIDYHAGSVTSWIGRQLRKK